MVQYCDVMAFFLGVVGIKKKEYLSLVGWHKYGLDLNILSENSILAQEFLSRHLTYSGFHSIMLSY